MIKLHHVTQAKFAKQDNDSVFNNMLYFLLQWMKLDDLFEQERTIRTAMTQRAGVIGLMLHQTVDHDPRSRMPRRRSVAEEAKAASQLAARRLDHDYEQRGSGTSSGSAGAGPHSGGGPHSGAGPHSGGGPHSQHSQLQRPLSGLAMLKAQTVN